MKQSAYSGPGRKKMWMNMLQDLCMCSCWPQLVIQVVKLGSNMQRKEAMKVHRPWRDLECTMHKQILTQLLMGL